MNLSDTIRIGQLLDVYGAMLTGKQRQVLNSYINYDGGLSEIASELQVTRQAVADLVKRTVKILEDYEAKLQIVKKLDKTKQLTKGDTTQEEIDKIWRQ